MKSLHPVAYVLVWAGALNWGLIGLFNFNLVNMLVGAWPMVEKLVYILVGAGGVYLLATHKDYCKYCGDGKK